MISDATMNQAALMSAINTSVLKKSMDTNEALMAQLVEGMQENSSVSSNATSSSNGLDIYA